MNKDITGAGVDAKRCVIELPLEDICTLRLIASDCGLSVPALLQKWVLDYLDLKNERADER